jgi:photosystem II stability/assembly factor-like uncharacterized protein
MRRRIEPAVCSMWVPGPLRIVQGLAVALLLVAVPLSPAEAGWNKWTRGIAPSADMVALAIDPSMPTTIYAAGFDLGLLDPDAPRGVFKSIDGGAHWSASNTGLTAAIVTVVAVDPKTPTTVYVGASKLDAWGVFKSTDGGAHWSASNAGFPPPLCGSTACIIPAVLVLAVDPRTTAILYAGTAVGVFKSTDGGAFWSASNTGLTDLVVGALTLDPQTPTTLYAATSTGVFKSIDGGAHWTPSDTGLPRCTLNSAPAACVSSLAVDPQTPATLYAGTSDGVFKSIDGGAHWGFSMTGVESVGMGVSAVAIDPQAPATLYAATLGAGVFRSTDGGRSWAPFNAGLSNLFLNDLQLSPSGACLHAASQQGIFDFVFHSDPCAPPINPLVSVNERTFSAGQTLVSSAALMNLGEPKAADIYLGILMPDGNTLAFFTSTGEVVFGSIADPASLRPLATGVSLAAPFTATAPNFFSYQWTGNEPHGDYLFFLLVTQADAPSDGTLTDDEVLALDVEVFSFP